MPGPGTGPRSGSSETRPYGTWTENSVQTVQECTQAPNSVIPCLIKRKCCTKYTFISCDISILRYVAPSNEVKLWSAVLSLGQIALFAVV